MRLPLCFLVLFCGCFSLAQAQNTVQKDSLFLPYNAVSELAALDTVGAKPLFVQNYLAKINGALAQKMPILALEIADSLRQKAQQIAMNDARFQAYLLDATTQKPMRNEIFGVFAARRSDIRPEYAALYENGDCYRVEMYNFALNLTTLGLVSLSANKVFDAALLQHTAPDIPAYLKEMALRIATESPEVERALGFKPTPEQALMADTKTALNRTRCERSQHLCVAPTFVKGEKALWAIVDLTDLRLVGVRWTNTSGSVPTQNSTQNVAQNAAQNSTQNLQNANPLGSRSVTQRGLEYENLTECFCKEELAHKTTNWDFKYIITSSDGLRISDVKYKDKLVVSSAKLVDWHVSYSKTDGFGYSDAVGCPFFSTATVLALEPPRISDLFENDKKVGIVLEQGFHSEGWPQPCNYNYVQRYELYDDGRLRCATASVGRGCGNDGTYRPVFRIAFPQNDNTFSEWDGTNWADWTTEKWQLQTELTQYDRDRFQYKITDKAQNGFLVEPSQGKFADKGRGDNAFVFITKNHADKDEGEADLITIGPCCNTDYRQGPEKFIEPQPENIKNETLVLWYVPQMKNDNRKGSEYCWAETYMKNGTQAVRTFPCFGGPMLVPIGWVK